MVRCADKVIMTDKIFKENPKYGKIELLSKLEDLMQAQIILIPWDRHEIFGHADGMVRYISESRVLLNNYADFDPSLRRRLVGALSPHFIVEELEYCSPRYNKLSWAYLNFKPIIVSLYLDCTPRKTCWPQSKYGNTTRIIK